jgi:anti-sigma factor RsiW
VDRDDTPGASGTRPTAAEDLSCRELVELVTEYLDRTLAPADRARFEAHLSGCPPCRRYLAQMRQTVRLLGNLTEDTVPPRARDGLLAAFRDWKRSRSIIEEVTP